MRKIRQVLRLHFEMQKSKRSIGHLVGVSRETVADYLTRAMVAELGWPLPPELDDAALEQLLFPAHIKSLDRRSAPDWAQIHQELKRKGATLRMLHNEFLAEHPDGLQYSQFCVRYREFSSTIKPSLRRTYAAGERVLVDYAGPTMPIRNADTGEILQAQIFVGVLGASNYTYVEAHWSQNLTNWLSAHTRMFEYFGGVPAVIVCDNLKAGVTTASRTEPIINESYKHMANHFGSVVVPARAGEPRDKAKVENGVLIVERWILFRLRNRIFTTMVDLNEAIWALVIELNEKPFQKLPGSRKSAFETIDRPALRPLPAGLYEYTEFRRVRVGLDYRVKVDERTYSVPNRLCKQAVELRITENMIEILRGGRCVASHQRHVGPPDVWKPEHMPLAHRHFGLWNISDALAWAQRIGFHVHAFLNKLFDGTRVLEQGYRIHNTLKKLEREFGSQRLDAACQRAISIGATSLTSVRSILRTQLDRLPNQVEDTQDATFEHPNVRGPKYYH